MCLKYSGGIGINTLVRRRVYQSFDHVTNQLFTYNTSPSQSQIRVQYYIYIDITDSFIDNKMYHTNWLTWYVKYNSKRWTAPVRYKMASNMRTLTAILTTHWELGLRSHTLYSNISAHAMWRRHTSYHSVPRALTMTLRGRRVRMHVYIYCGPHVCYHLTPIPPHK